eukprot:TRINITY_DN42265_c0_g1_i1.p1 TRINITY_DN42265_c0_g1~~TRINITY_DN42265_c0_g1_i1.p1  ORF type:complete len:235 (+),score=41.40 TRINITY_DN42265_c0_g1_i1:341-1045(+)
MQKELSLNYVDVVTSNKTLNFLTPPPIILPAKEQVFINRFTISQLYSLIEELRSISYNNQMKIESQLILQIFIRKSNSTFAKEELPEILQQKDIFFFQQLLLNLDVKSTGYISGKALCTYLCLLNTPIISKNETLELRENLSNASVNGMIGKGDFLQIKAWFDDYENCEEEINVNYFEREMYIKELIFFILKSDNNLMKIDEYINILECKDYLEYELESENQQFTYFHLLFMDA